MPSRRRRTSNSSRKFVWARHAGAFDPTDTPGVHGVDLLSQFQENYGAQLIGATVVRIRGYVVPTSDGSFTGNFQGRWGILVDSDNTDVTLASNDPGGRPFEDWMAYQPFSIATGGQSTTLQQVATGNVYANEWAVDVRSSRKIEELGEGLYLFWNLPESTWGLNWELSIGLKLP